MNVPKNGTRMTLSERFKLIRLEQQKTRKIMMNPMIEQQQHRRSGSYSQEKMQSFYSTVSRTDRPSATLHQGSERNKRLVLQMAANDALMDEIDLMNNYNGFDNNNNDQNHLSFNGKNSRNMALPPIKSMLYSDLIALPSINQSVHSRLGRPNSLGASPSVSKLIQKLDQTMKNALVSAGNVSASKNRNIKSRLGPIRKPISERLGLKTRGRINNPLSSRLAMNRNNAINSNSNERFKRKIVNPKQRFNERSSVTNRVGRQRINNGNQNRRAAIRRKKSTATFRSKKPTITAENLDQDLETYMNSAGN